MYIPASAIHRCLFLFKTWIALSSNLHKIIYQTATHTYGRRDTFYFTSLDKAFKDIIFKQHIGTISAFRMYVTCLTLSGLPSYTRVVHQYS